MKTTPKLPVGYRWVKPDELLEDGDEWLEVTAGKLNWTRGTGHLYGFSAKELYLYRRKVVQPLPTKKTKAIKPANTWAPLTDPDTILREGDQVNSGGYRWVPVNRKWWGERAIFRDPQWTCEFRRPAPQSNEFPLVEVFTGTHPILVGEKISPNFFCTPLQESQGMHNGKALPHHKTTPGHGTQNPVRSTVGCIQSTDHSKPVEIGPLEAAQDAPRKRSGRPRKGRTQFTVAWEPAVLQRARSVSYVTGESMSDVVNRWANSFLTLHPDE